MIETKKLVYKFVLDRNHVFDRVTTDVIMKYGMSMKVSKQETGFVLQELKKMGALWHSKRDGWIAKG